MFIAYTQGGGQTQKPTLYFTKGRYTQVHDHADNVGFHPNHAGQFSANIKPAHLAVVNEAKRQRKIHLDNYKEKIAAAEKASREGARSEVSEAILKSGNEHLLKYFEKNDEVSTFCENFRNGAYTADVNDKFSKCFEVSPPRENKNQWITHQSRGRLIYPNDPTYDKTFNDEYIRNVLQNGHYAANVPPEDVPVVAK